MRTRRDIALALAGALAALILVGTVGPHRADGRGLKTGLLDSLFMSTDPTLRTRWLDEAAGARAEIIRINVVWDFTVGSSRPSDPTDPADPAYDFGEVDAAVKDAHARGMEVLLTPLWAPEWAEGANRPDEVVEGAWKPNPEDLARLRAGAGHPLLGRFR